MHIVKFDLPVRLRLRRCSRSRCCSRYCRYSRCCRYHSPEGRDSPRCDDAGNFVPEIELNNFFPLFIRFSCLYCSAVLQAVDEPGLWQCLCFPWGAAAFWIDEVGFVSFVRLVWHSREGRVTLEQKKDQHLITFGSSVHKCVCRITLNDLHSLTPSPKSRNCDEVREPLRGRPPKSEKLCPSYF